MTIEEQTDRRYVWTEDEVWPYIKSIGNSWIGNGNRERDFNKAYIYSSRGSLDSIGKVHWLEIDSEGYLCMPKGAKP
jgi:hypothetical protein